MVKHERVDSKYGHYLYQYSDTDLWITEAEANGLMELAALWQEIFQMIESQFPIHEVQFFIDASNEKMLEKFIESPKFQIEYVSFKLMREGSI